MSYRIRLRGEACQYCGCVAPNPDCPDPTYNLGPIFCAVLPENGLHELNGKMSVDTDAALRTALAAASDPKNRATLTSLEPKNKWGNLEDAIWVLGELVRLGTEYPRHRWEVS